MRIVFVIYSLEGGGAERVTTILSRHWASLGHTVKVVTFAEESANFYKLSPEVEYESLHYPDIGSTPWKTVMLNLSRALILRRQLKAFRPDVVIGMMSTISAVVAFACMGLPCKAIGTERVYPPQAGLSPFRDRIRRISYRFLDAVVVLTGEASQWIKTHTAAKAIYVIPNPLAWPLENSTPLLPPDETCVPGRSIVLAVGRFVPQKGFDRLIEVFSHLEVENPSWDLVILGTGPDRPILEARRDELGLNGRVFFPGRAGNMGDWYRRASIFALTSLFEGFPNALLEAMAYGLPVISTDCDTGPRDLIENGVNGLLVADGDQEALTAGLRQLMRNGDMRDRFSTNARKVTEDYALDNIWLRWHAVFDAMAAASQRGA